MTKQRSVVSAEEKKDMNTTLNQVRNFLKVVTTEKAMKVFNRTKNDNVKLDKFLTGNFTIPKAFQADKVNAEIDALINPKKHDHHGLIKVEQQKLLLKTICKEMVSLEVAKKTEWLATYKLNEEQEAKALEALKKYENTLIAAIKTVSNWEKVYGN